MSYLDEVMALEYPVSLLYVRGFRIAQERSADIAARADARIAELERDIERLDAQWRDELRIYRETEDVRIAELESRLSKLLHAAENVRRWDWSDNDEDCVDDILKLGDAIDAARANGGEG